MKRGLKMGLPLPKLGGREQQAPEIVMMEQHGGEEMSELGARRGAARTATGKDETLPQGWGQTWPWRG